MMGSLRAEHAGTKQSYTYSVIHIITRAHAYIHTRPSGRHGKAGSASKNRFADTPVGPPHMRVGVQTDREKVAQQTRRPVHRRTYERAQHSRSQPRTAPAPRRDSAHTGPAGTGRRTHGQKRTREARGAGRGTGRGKGPAEGAVAQTGCDAWFPLVFCLAKMPPCAERYIAASFRASGLRVGSKHVKPLA